MSLTFLSNLFSLSVLPVFFFRCTGHSWWHRFIISFKPKCDKGLLLHLHFVMSNCYRSNFTCKIHKWITNLYLIEKKASISLKITCYKYWHFEKKKRLHFPKNIVKHFCCCKNPPWYFAHRKYLSIFTDKLFDKR